MKVSINIKVELDVNIDGLPVGAVLDKPLAQAALAAASAAFNAPGPTLAATIGAPSLEAAGSNLVDETTLAIISAAICAAFGPKTRLLAVRYADESGAWSTSGRQRVHHSHSTTVRRI